MAFAIIQDTEQPKFTVLSSYTVERLGQFPICRAMFEECVYLLDAPVIVSAVEDLDGDGLSETLSIPEWAVVDSGSLLQKFMATTGSDFLGQITQVSLVELSSAITDDSGSIVTPAVTTMKVTLSTPLPINVVSGSVAIIEQNVTGALAYRRARLGKQWVIELNAESPEQLARIIQMLGTIYFQAVKAVLPALNVEKTDEEIFAALQMVALEGNNIDGFFASSGDQLELDRRAGNGVGSVRGSAPRLS